MRDDEVKYHRSGHARKRDQIESRCAVSISKDPNLKHFYEKNFKNWGNDKLLEDNLQSLLSSVTSAIDDLIPDSKRQLIETSLSPNKLEIFAKTKISF